MTMADVTLTTTEPIYSDVDPELRTDHGGNILVLEDTDAIDASIENVLAISRGELVMQLDVGSDLEGLVGQNVDDNSAAMVRMLVVDALDQDPRVLVEKLSIRALPDENMFDLLLQYGLDVGHLRAEFARLVELG